jgi:hypothetical protein
MNKNVIIWKDKSITYEGGTKSLKTDFNDWIENGNVIKINGYFSTQDSLWRNKIKSEKDLFKYYVEQFIINTK